jgi:hypothetical protein
MVKLSDSSIQTVVSNCYGVTPVCKIERTGTAFGKRTKPQVDCPSVIQKYNKYIGGVDQFDVNVDHF